MLLENQIKRNHWRKKRIKSEPQEGSFFMCKIIKFSMRKMNLTECCLNKNYVIVNFEILDEDVKNHLKNLGFDVNEKIKVLHINFGRSAYLVKVLGIKYAIDKRVACGVIVKDE